MGLLSSKWDWIGLEWLIVGFYWFFGAMEVSEFGTVPFLKSKRSWESEVVVESKRYLGMCYTIFDPGPDLEILLNSTGIFGTHQFILDS